MKRTWILPITFIMVISSYANIPVFAEVTSFQVDRQIYTLGNKIYFTGTVGIADYQKLVNLVIHDPNGKFVLITGNYSDSTYIFKIVVDTNNTSQFITKGTYQAIAFVGKQSAGMTLYFDFSPDGSPVIHQVPSSTNTQGNRSSNQSSSQHYQTQLKENIGLVDNVENFTKVAIPKKTLLNQFDYQNILYPLMVICGAAVIAAILYAKKHRSNTTQKTKGTEQSSAATTLTSANDDYALMILKNRLAKGEIEIEEFKAVKDALDEP